MGSSVLHIPNREIGNHPTSGNSDHRCGGQDHPKRETVPDPKPSRRRIGSDKADNIDQIGGEASFDCETNANKT